MQHAVSTPTRARVAGALRHVARGFALVALTAATASAQSLPGSLVYSAAGGTIRDNLQTTFTFNVGATDVLPATGGITVRFRDLVDPIAGDLWAVLAYTAPNESSVTRATRLFSMSPTGHDGRSFDGSYSFGTSFAALLPTGAAPAGDYGFDGDAAAGFFGASIAGTYHVQVFDWFSNGGATVGGVDLAFDVGATNVVPEPSTVLLLGAGLLGVCGITARRRRLQD